MHTALYLFAASAAVLVGIGSVIAMVALRRAPEGIETSEGFQVIDNVIEMPRVAEVAPSRAVVRYSDSLGQAA